MTFKKRHGRSIGRETAFLVVPLLAASMALMPPTVDLPRAEADDSGAAAQRVVILPSFLAAYATLDQKLGHVAGTSRIEKSDFDKDILSRIYSDVDAIVPVNIPPDPEAMLLLNPDALITQDIWLPMLKAVGLHRLSSYQYSASLDARLAQWLELGNISGKMARAQALRTHFLTSRDKLKASIGSRKEHPRVAFFIGGTEVGLGFLYGEILHLNGLIDVLGAINVSRGNRIRTVPTPESVAVLDPDFIFLGSDLAAGEGAKKLYLSHEWQIVRAVRDKRVYRIPPSHFFAPTLDENLLLQWFAEILYPDLPRTLRSAYREEFHFIHDTTLTDDDLDKLLSIDQNAMSAGYMRFSRKNAINRSH